MTAAQSRGEGTLTLINGVPTMVEYRIGRDALSAWDEFFRDRGFVDFGLKELTMAARGFNYVEEIPLVEEGQEPPEDFPYASYDWWGFTEGEGTISSA